jgi:urea carboxylase/allophanate hydrolase
MEVEIRSPVVGRCMAVMVRVGDLIDVDDDLIIVGTENR